MASRPNEFEKTQLLWSIAQELARLRSLIESADQGIRDAFVACQEALRQTSVAVDPAYKDALGPGLQLAQDQIGRAVTALQFHDIAAQILSRIEDQVDKAAQDQWCEAMSVPNPAPAQSSVEPGAVTMF